MACLSDGELGDSSGYVEARFAELLGDVRGLRAAVAAGGPPPQVVSAQVGRLEQSCGDLREIFDAFLGFPAVEPEDLERAVMRLAGVWREVRLRVALVGAFAPLPAPLPGLTSEQEAYYQGILDGLFDRFAARA